MGKKKIKPSTDNVFEIIDSVSLSIRDDKVDEPATVRLYTERYTRPVDGLIRPRDYKIELSGTCRDKKLKYADVLNRLVKFVHLNRIGSKVRRRNETIVLMVALFKKYSDKLDLSFKVVPVRGNKADYDLIYNYFDLKVEEA